MARRDRVPRLKSHRKKKNKNPKLSPFQREQKRNKLANQAPIVKENERDAPKSQRLVLEYLEKKQKEKEAKRAETLRRLAEKEATGEKGNEISKNVSSTEDSIDKRTSKQAKRVEKNSLNALLSSSLGPAKLGVASKEGEGSATIIARKKAKKHAKRVEARKERVKAQIEKMTTDLEKLTRTKKKGKKDLDQNLVFEKKLKQMQREKAAEEKKMQKMQKKGQKSPAVHESEDGESAAMHPEEATKPKKSIVFLVDENEAETKASKSASLSKNRAEKASVRDFSDLVDIVRFNDRVEAPPVFTSVPNKNASVSRLASRLESTESNSANKEVRHRLLSSVGGLGEVKRLNRLGLAPAITTRTVAADAKISKEKEMELLRASVVAAYQKKKRRRLEDKGVDMTHQFPTL